MFYLISFPRLALTVYSTMDLPIRLRHEPTSQHTHTHASAIGSLGRQSYISIYIYNVHSLLFGLPDTYTLLISFIITFPRRAIHSFSSLKSFLHLDLPFSLS